MTTSEAPCTYGMSHEYLATACLHAISDDCPELHLECQKDGKRWDGTRKVAATCKWCEAPCICFCHEIKEEQR